MLATQQKISVLHYLVLGFIIVYYGVAFFMMDAVTSRLVSDEINWHYPTIVDFATNPFFEVIQDYKSATFPTYHLIYAFFYQTISENPVVLRFISFLFIVATVCLLFYYLSKQKKYELSTVVLIIAAFLSSPYYRGSGFSLITDNLPYFFLILALIFNDRAISKKSLPLFILSMLLAFGTFYTRQFYFWVPFFFYFRSLPHLPNLKQMAVFTVANCFYMLPALYLFNLWQGLTPPMFQDQMQNQSFILTIPFTLAVFPVYLYPIALYLFFGKFIKITRNELILMVGVGLAYILTYYQLGLDLDSIRGGLIPKLLGKLPQPLDIIAFLGLSYVGLLLIFYFLRGNFTKNYYLLLIVFALAISLQLFQRYVDPLIFIVVILFYDKKTSHDFINSKYVLLFIATEILLYVGSLFYYDFTNIQT